jgi:DNA-directed RNA polymerase subunit RPC12/RpoP
MRYIIKIMSISALILFLGFNLVKAREDEISLKLSRDFGYSSGTGKIQGLFSIKVTSSEQLGIVVFYIDSEEIGKDNLAPFKIQFNTDDYSPGVHSIYALGSTLEGKELKTKEIMTEFVSPQESKKAALSLIIPILGISLIIVVISAIIPALTTKKEGNVIPGSQRNYGVAGGTICSRCDRPFSRHLLAPNLLAGKLERCPYCGKWGIFRAYPLDMLRKAEDSELIAKPNVTLPGNDDELHGELDKTKYQDL